MKEEVTTVNIKEARYGKQICGGAEAASAHTHGRDLHGDASLTGIAEKRRKIAIEQQMMRGQTQVSREDGGKRNEER